MGGQKIIITTAEGQTGHLIADLLLSEKKYSDKIDTLYLATTDPDHEHVQEFKDKATIVPCKPGDLEGSVKALKETKADTIMMIPPSVENKLEMSKEMLESAMQAGLKNIVLLSAAACDMAERDKQPRLREFADIETLLLQAGGSSETDAQHNPCIIRAGFYAENLLLYNKQAKDSGKLPLPIGPTHKLAPVALGDVALLCANILTNATKSGLPENARGQMITLTGPATVSGAELAEAASQGLGTKMAYEEIKEAQAKKILNQQAEISDAEKEYLLESYALVREGKLNYISTHGFHAITGQSPTEVTEFFKTYAEEFKPKKRKTTKK